MENLLNIAKKVITVEAEALLQMASQLDRNYVMAVQTMQQCQGRIVVCGMGKSGIIGKKIAATLSSTGTPSFFLHPSEAIHGDLGMICKEDVFVSISNSGETDEILRIIPHVQQLGISHITLVGRPESTLAQHANFVLDVSVREEGSDLEVAPMASTTAALAMGDALAAGLIHENAFKAENFAVFHPGGSLGKKLLSKVAHFMQSDPLPIIQPTTLLREVLWTITKSQVGLAIVCDSNKAVLGIITDGDLRRTLQEHPDHSFFELTAQSIMSKNPKQISPDAALVEAEELMHSHKITTLAVVENNQLIGVLAEHHI